MFLLLFFIIFKQTFKDVTVPPLIKVISKENVKREWMLTKNIVKSLKYPVEKFQDLWTLLTKHHGPELQNIIQLAQYAIVLPLHTADCVPTAEQNNNKTQVCIISMYSTNVKVKHIKIFKHINI